MSLAIGFIVLVVFLSIFLFYAILVLRDVSKVVEDVEEVVDKVHNALIQPLKAVDYLVQKVAPVIEIALEKRMKRKKK